jgi:hypothetical protein
MPGSTGLIPRRDPRPPKRQSKTRQQFDIQALAIEVQTVLLMLSDLRTRVSELEKKLNTDKIMDADRALLKNLDRMLVEAKSPKLLLSGPECASPSLPVGAARRYR